MDPPEAWNSSNHALHAAGPGRFKSRRSDTASLMAKYGARRDLPCDYRKRGRFRQQNSRIARTVGRLGNKRLERLPNLFRGDSGSRSNWTCGCGRRRRVWGGLGHSRILNHRRGSEREWRRPRKGRSIQGLRLGRDLCKQFRLSGASRTQAGDFVRLIARLRGRLSLRDHFVPVSATTLQK